MSLRLNALVLYVLAACHGCGTAELSVPTEADWTVLRSLLPHKHGEHFYVRVGNVDGLGYVAFLYLEESSPELKELQLEFPLLAFSRGSPCTGYTFVPARSTGDVADLYYRITGKEHPTLKGELSGEYKAFLEGKER